MKNLVRCLPLLALMACKHQATDVQPKLVDKTSAANYDALAKDTGYWRWTSTYFPWNRPIDSSTIGYGRHLLFKNDSSLVVHRTNLPDLVVPYHLSPLYVNSYNRNVQAISFNTGESITPTLNMPSGKWRVYLFTYANATRSLDLSTEDFSFDGGNSSSYKWVPEP